MGLLAEGQLAAAAIFSTWWFWGLIAAIALAVGWLITHLVSSRDIWQEGSLDPNLDWGPADQIAKSLEKVYEFAVDYSQRSIDWYAKRRKPKRIYGIALRANVILLTAFAGLVPILPEVFAGIEPPAALSTVALALAALFVSLDHFGGFTSGWVRYMFAQQQIERLRHKLLLDWQIWRAKSGAQPDVAQGLILIETFLAGVNRVIDDETKQWAAEFQSALKELERAAKEAAEKIETGALQIAVSNPDAVDGWTLEINGTRRGSYSSGNAVVTNLAPGIHKIRAAGSKSGKELAAETAASVAAGQVDSVALTLT